MGNCEPLQAVSGWVKTFLMRIFLCRKEFRVKNIVQEHVQKTHHSTDTINSFVNFRNSCCLGCRSDPWDLQWCGENRTRKDKYVSCSAIAIFILAIKQTYKQTTLWNSIDWLENLSLPQHLVQWPRHGVSHFTSPAILLKTHWLNTENLV